MAFQSSLSLVLMMSSLLGDSFLVTKLFRPSAYFVRCLPLLLVPKIFPFNFCFSNPSALFICPKMGSRYKEQTILSQLAPPPPPLLATPLFLYFSFVTPPHTHTHIIYPTYTSRIVKCGRGLCPHECVSKEVDQHGPG